jgi:PAS domain S-box-containing protein
MEQKVNILMVDDQPAKLLTYEAILGELGENLVKAASAREALELLLKMDIAVVLMDVSMPELDGFQLAEMIRQHPRFQKIAIIFVSAVHLTDWDKLQGYQRGAMDYISVPVIPELLRAKVSVFAELHRKARELELLNRELEQRVLSRTEELRESETQFRTLANSIPQLAWMANPDGSVSWSNQRWYDYTGKPLNQVQGWQWQRFHHPDHARRVTESIRRCWETGEPWEETSPLLGRDGEYRWFLSRAIPIRDLQGTVVRWFGTSTDISAQIAAEQELRQRADLLDLATEAIMVRDMQGILQFWNSGAEALYGWKRSEVLGKNVHQLLRTRFPTSADHIKSVIAEQGRWEGNLVQFDKQGREVVVASRQVLQAGGEPGSEAILEISRDITAQLQAEEALRKAEKLAAMGRVAGIIAHEINNPLDAIRNAFYLLHDHPSLDDDALKYTRIAEEELTRVTHITRQTLSFYRESKEAVPVFISELLDDILALQSRQLRQSGISLEKEYQGDAPVQGFPGELKQVFLNLVGNAIQAMPEGGRLRIRVREAIDRTRQRQGVVVSIADTGSGIRPEDAKQLFEPFFTTKSTKGTGLGLWISKGIIQKYEGVIRFRSMRLLAGHTTSFSVFIPTSPSLQTTEHFLSSAS